MTREQELEMDLAHWKDRALQAEARIDAYMVAFFAKKDADRRLDNVHATLCYAAESRRDTDEKERKRQAP